MKIFYRKLNVLFLLLNFVGIVHTEANTKKALFIGNSLTCFNNMPQTVAAIGQAMGDTLAVTVYAPGGTGFINHYADPAVYQYFRQGGWDYVILQPGSNESPGYSVAIDTTIMRGRMMQDSIHYYNPCAQVVLYEISYGVANAQSNANYFATQTLIKNNLITMSDSMHTYMSPAGEVMRTIWRRDTSFLIWNSYGDIHPNGYGSYAIACAFAGVIFKKHVEGLPYYNGLDSIKCVAYQHIADSIVFTAPGQWRIGQYQPHAGFNYNVNGTTVNFHNQSLYYDQLVWSFGDGTTSSQTNPSKSYALPGVYPVHLAAYRNNCADEYDTVVAVTNGNTSVSTINTAKEYFVYPNPAGEIIYITSDTAITGPINFQLSDITGRRVLQQKITASGRAVGMGTLAPGVYFYTITDSKGNVAGGRLTKE